MPLILFGMAALISGISLLLYFLYYPRQRVTTNVVATTRPIPTRMPNMDPSKEPFVTQSASPSALLHSSLEQYRDDYLSLSYPSGFDVIAGETAENESYLFGSELLHSISFFAPESDIGFSVDIWSKKAGQTLPLWWKSLFSQQSGQNKVRNIVLKETDLTTAEQIGTYQVYKLSLGTPVTFYLFEYKDWIVVFSSTMGNTKTVIESIQ